MPPEVDRGGRAGLALYATHLDAVEVNTTFYRPHRLSTLERWAASVPPGFRFAVKAPRTITHEQRLVGSGDSLRAFLDQCAALGDRCGPLLFQLPPTLAFDPNITDRFLAGLRHRFDGSIVWEPRHPTWFQAPADSLLADHRIARVAADPPRAPTAAAPGGWRGLAYYRLHGSPRIYWSDYDDGRLETLARQLVNEGAAETWCIFDNTASRAAVRNALKLRRLIHHSLSHRD